MHDPRNLNLRIGITSLQARIPSKIKKIQLVDAELGGNVTESPWFNHIAWVYLISFVGFCIPTMIFILSLSLSLLKLQTFFSRTILLFIWTGNKLHPLLVNQLWISCNPQLHKITTTITTTKVTKWTLRLQTRFLKVWPFLINTIEEDTDLNYFKTVNVGWGQDSFRDLRSAEYLCHNLQEARCFLLSLG